ncbi:MAG TPA: tRNA (N6-isopentenyl adenosine(37)-C2)-methylthiotransferase MiaB, partial [Bacteroidetes bacterium]|nr:tRNA (N6-isopentenyl adenosine(37)-C2)-methylthiotransferase MiaB [Bacteroidota bacterium]
MTNDAIIEESIQGTATVLKNTLQPENKHKKVYIETYGCHMNFSDSEIVASILKDQNYITTDNEHDADLLFINTCSIRDKAEQTVRNRLNQLKNIKKKNSKVKVGILGCMAERLKTKLLEEEQLVDMVVGP